MHLKDLKLKAPAELVSMAEELGVEGASTIVFTEVNEPCILDAICFRIR